MKIRKIVTTCTRDCPNSCGLVATVKDGRLVRLQGDPGHPLTGGTACHKTSKYIKRMYSAERITHPMRKVDGRWQRAGWDEVLDLVADKLKTVIRESGPEAILYYQGYGERTALKLLNKYFFNLLGGVTTLRGSLCGGAGQGAQNLDFGNRISHDPLDHYNSRSMILWARNPVSTNISLVKIVKDIRERGGRVIVIDPVRSRSVAIADHHIAPKPGRDGYLAMAATKCILDAGVEDGDFLDRRSIHFAGYKAILDRFTVPELCSLAGVAVSDATLIAKTLMEQFPTSILLGWGLHRHEYAHYAIRPIDALSAVSGNIGVPGGGVSQGFEEYGPYDQSYWGDSLHPEHRTFFIGEVGEEILNAIDPAIRMIYVTASNPVCMAPNANKVSRAFDSAEMVVYSGHFLDDTADHADIFLPATTFLEEDDLVASYGHNYLGPVNPVIEPVGETKSEFEMFQELATRFSFAGQYRKSVDEWLTLLCAPILGQEVDLPTLKKKAFRLDAPMVPYADGKFPTDSGRYQFMTEFDPALLETDIPAYPYRFLTIAPHGHICSERTMADHAPLPTVMLSAVEARRIGVREDRPVVVRSKFGKIMARLKVDERMRNDVVVAERGGWNKAGHGFNLLTRDMASNVGQGTPFYETRVTVKPCKEDGIVGSNVLVVQNGKEFEGGVFCKELARLGVLLTWVRPGDGDPLPTTPEGYARLVVLDGPHRASDDEACPHFTALMRLMRDFDDQGKSVAGFGLGCQLLARAHGGELHAMPEPEFGFIDHVLTPDGEADPVMGGNGPLPALLAFNEDTFDLPEEAALLVKGERCVNQCFKIGNSSYGFQFRLEVESVTLEAWVAGFRDSGIKTDSGLRIRYTDAFFADMRERFPILVPRSNEFCARVARDWLRLGQRQPE